MDAIIMAAGLGRRMNTNTNKALTMIMERPMIDYIYDALKKVGSNIIIAASEDNIKELNNLYKDAKIVLSKTKGTGGALKDTIDLVLSPYFYLVPCDMPLIDEYDLLKLKEGYYDSYILAGINDSENEYGKILNNPIRIVETKNSVSNIVNGGIYLFNREFVKNNIDKLILHNNEYYVTDLIELGRASYELSGNIYGVNTLVDKQKVFNKMKNDILNFLLKKGIEIIDLEGTIIDRKSIIEKNTKIKRATIINSIISENNTVIDSVIKNTNIGYGNIIKSSDIKDSIILDNNAIGPFSHIRENTIIGNTNKIGNFVEIKNSYIKNNNKISHHAYIGDSIMGSGNNISCGVITSNYNGKEKNKTIMGDNNFIGSNSNLIAPIRMGNFNYIASASTLNKNLNDYDFYISRKKGIIKKGYAKKYFK